MSTIDAVLRETARAYGYPAEVSRGLMGTGASGPYGGLWTSTGARFDNERPPPRNVTRRALRQLLEMLRAQPSLEPWRPWTRWLAKGAP